MPYKFYQARIGQLSPVLTLIDLTPGGLKLNIDMGMKSDDQPTKGFVKIQLKTRLMQVVREGKHLVVMEVLLKLATSR